MLIIDRFDLTVFAVDLYCVQNHEPAFLLVMWRLVFRSEMIFSIDWALFCKSRLNHARTVVDPDRPWYDLHGWLVVKYQESLHSGQISQSRESQRSVGAVVSTPRLMRTSPTSTILPCLAENLSLKLIVALAQHEGRGWRGKATTPYRLHWSGDQNTQWEREESFKKINKKIRRFKHTWEFSVVRLFQATEHTSVWWNT